MIKFLAGSCLSELGIVLKEPLAISELLTSRNFNCNLFRLEGQHQLGAGVDKRLLIHDFA